MTLQFPQACEPSSAARKVLEMYYPEHTGGPPLRMSSLGGMGCFGGTAGASSLPVSGAWIGFGFTDLFTWSFLEGT